MTLPYRVLTRAFVLMLVMGATAPVVSQAQQPGSTGPAARGLYNWIHSTADSERSFPFYRDVLGIELTRSPFAGPAPANAPPERIAPVSNAAPDPLIWDLTNTKGSRFRNVFTRAANTPFGLEHSEFLDIERDTRTANAWDPGASRLIFRVRDLAAAVAAASRAGAPVVTLGGAPVDTPGGRAILVRDPDGYLVEMIQASPVDIAAAGPGQVVGTTIGITVANTERALRFYRGLLGFAVRGATQATTTDLRVLGLSGGKATFTQTVIPETNITVVLSEFMLPSGTVARPFQWRIQDVGAPQFQLQVRNLDALIEQTKAAGYRFLSVGAKPIQRAFGRFVFAIDSEGVLVEYVEPTAPTR